MLDNLDAIDNSTVLRPTRSRSLVEELCWCDPTIRYPANMPLRDRVRPPSSAIGEDGGILGGPRKCIGFEFR